jgi:hypothetical protein
MSTITVCDDTSQSNNRGGWSCRDGCELRAETQHDVAAACCGAARTPAAVEPPPLPVLPLLGPPQNPSP